MASEQKKLAVESMYGQAVEHFNSGDFAETLKICNAIIQIQRDHLPTMNIMGIVAQRQNRHAQAVEYFRQAIKITQEVGTLYYNLGISLQHLGKTAEAVEVLQIAAARDPGNRQIADHLQRVLHSSQPTVQQTTAQEAMQLALQLHHAGDLDGAKAKYQQTLQLQPHNPAALSNLAIIFTMQKQLPAAVAALENALAIKADFPQAHYNLGNAMLAQGKLPEAICSYQQAIKQKPDYAEAYCNLGSALQRQNQLLKAIDCYQKAVGLNADYAEAYNNLGNAYAESGDFDAAIACFQQATRAVPDYADALGNLGNTLKDLGNISEAITALQRAIAINPNHITAHSNLLLALHYGDYDQDRLLAEHKIWYARHFQQSAQTPYSGKIVKDPDKKLHIGFVSRDFRKHSVSYFLYWLFLAHNREEFEFYCYSSFRIADEVTQALQKMVTGWREIADVDDQAVAVLVKNDQIDILLDLAGHTKGNRLAVFAKKPAPIQITWLGYPDTTGMACMDYRLTDAIADPPGVADSYCVEKLKRLGEGFLVYHPPAEAPELLPPPQIGSGQITFASFNNLAKISGPVVKVWAEILRATPNSRLLLKAKALGSSQANNRYLDLFAAESIDSQRLQFLPGTPTTQGHLAQYNQVDIALDPFPYNGTTTTCEALWMGVPVVTLLGKAHAGRVGASLLTQVGLGSCIANDIKEYVQKAAMLAQDQTYLANLRLTMRKRVQNSSLGDGPRFAAKMEQAFREIWCEWVNHDERR